MMIKRLLKRFYKWGFSGTDAEKYNPQIKIYEYVGQSIAVTLKRNIDYIPFP